MGGDSVIIAGRPAVSQENRVPVMPRLGAKSNEITHHTGHTCECNFPQALFIANYFDQAEMPPNPVEIDFCATSKLRQRI